MRGLHESNVLEKNTTINYLYLIKGGVGWDQENTCFSLLSHCFLYEDSWTMVSLESNYSTLHILAVNFILITRFPKKLSALTFVDRCHNISQ